MEDKRKDKFQIEIKTTSNVVIGGDVVSGDKTPSGESALETGQRSGGGIAIAGASVSISGDVVGGSKTYIHKSMDDRSVSCPNCGRSYLPVENNFACPNCGSATPKEFLKPTG